MNANTSSCEITTDPSPSPGDGRPVSRVMRFQPGFRWQGVPVTEYKTPANHWCGIQRTLLIGDQGESTGFHLRYFEIAPGGFSSLESHQHEHAVVVLRGTGKV